MDVTALRGVVPAVVTPFDGNGAVDIATLERLVDLLVDRGVHGIMAVGGTGEFPHLSDTERLEVLRAVVSTADRRVPVIAGTAACATDSVVAMAEDAAKAGADAVITVPPYYFPLPEAAVVGFFATLAHRSPLPLFVYNNPSYTGNPLGPTVIVELLQHPGIVGLKQSAADIGQLVEVVHRLRALHLDRAVFTGIDSQFCAALAVGAEGIFSTAAGLVPGEVVRIFDLMVRGDLAGARERQLALQPLNRFLEYDPGYVAPAKEALRMMGIEVGHPRPPLPGLDDEERERLRLALHGLETIA